MKWTQEKIEKFTELAPSGCGSKKIGEILGCTQHAVWTRAHILGITIKAPEYRRRQWRGLSQSVQEPSVVRARWATLLPAMKEQLRADIRSM